VGTKKDLAALLEDVTLFSRCTAGQRRTVARHAQIADLPAGIELVRKGEPGDALFVILEGEAVVNRDGVELNRVGPGAYFGELAILDGEPRTATVVAETDVKVAVIGIRMFRTMLREFSDLAEQLLVALAGELRAARGHAEVQSAT
jgi:CRP-like cAMP-binding protein